MSPRLALALLLVTAALAFGIFAMRHRLLESLLFFPLRAVDATPEELRLAWSDVGFDTSDGERLHGWWIRARDQPAAAHVLFFHGNGGNVMHRLEVADALATRGLDVFLFDYRGYGRSTGRPSEAGTYADARAARDALLRQEGVVPTRVVYLGESLGGAVAIELATAHPPAALVLQSAFTDLDSLAALHYPFIPAFLVPDAYPSLRRLPSLACPMLVLHGERDSIIPVAHGRALAAAARGPKELRIVAGADHNDLPWVMGAAYGETIAEWIRGAVGTGRP